MKKTIAAIAAFAAVLSMTPGLSAADESAPKRGFAAADANGDGKLDLTEFTKMVSKHLGAPEAKERFAKLDKDGDGFLTRQEFRAGREGGKKKEKEKEEARN